LPDEDMRMTLPKTSYKDMFPSLDPSLFVNSVHLFVQAKGGTGKTYAAQTFASFCQTHLPDLPLACYDLDSVNDHSFCKFAGLGVQRISDVERGESLLSSDVSRFDTAFNTMIEGGTGGVVVIDTGSSSYVKILGYLGEIDYASIITEDAPERWRFFLHVPISGNVADDCKQTIDDLRKVFCASNIEWVIWNNEFFGPLAGFLANNLERLHGIFRQDRSVNLPPVNRETLGKILVRMREEGLTPRQLMEGAGLSPIDVARVTQYYYGNSRLPGLYAQLADCDWSRG
jgi:hypothetical protein